VGAAHLAVGCSALGGRAAGRAEVPLLQCTQAVGAGGGGRERKHVVQQRVALQVGLSDGSGRHTTWSPVSLAWARACCISI